MTSLSKRSVVLLFVLIASAAMLSAQTDSALLFATGKVTLNGTAVSSSSSVFSGDRLVTNDSSMVSVNRSGSSVVVSPNSTVQYESSKVEVIEGAAHVNTVSGMAAEVGSVSIAPKDQSAKFDVVRVDNQVLVTSREGVVTVNDGGHTVILQPGDHTTLSLAGAASPVATGKAAATSDLLAGGPFYSVVKSDEDLPICPSLQTCIRPNVSQIRPCRCKP